LDVVSNWCDQVETDARTTYATSQHTARSAGTSGAPELTLFETAGAVFSPVNETSTNFDLARAIGEALWILVAPDRLGVLHDVATTLECMSTRGRSPDVILLSQPDPTDTSAGTNRAELERLGIATVSALIPFRGTLERCAAAAIASRLVGNVEG
jgi:dethiobiotin synthetase